MWRKIKQMWENTVVRTKPIRVERGNDKTKKKKTNTGENSCPFQYEAVDW